MAFYEPSGVLVLHVWTDLGESVLEPLMLRLRAVERIAAFVSALRKQDHHHQRHHFPQQTEDDMSKPRPSVYACELAALHRLVFCYGDFSPNPWSSSSVLAGELVLDDRNGIPLDNERDALCHTTGALQSFQGLNDGGEVLGIRQKAPRSCSYRRDSIPARVALDLEEELRVGLVTARDVAAFKGLIALTWPFCWGFEEIRNEEHARSYMKVVSLSRQS